MDLKSTDVLLLHPVNGKSPAFNRLYTLNRVCFLHIHMPFEKPLKEVLNSLEKWPPTIHSISSLVLLPRIKFFFGTTFTLTQKRTHAV